MPGSQDRRDGTQPWRRRLLAAALAPTAIAVLSGAAALPPGPTPTTGTLHVKKTDASSGKPLPGTTFQVLQQDNPAVPGTPIGPPITTNALGLVDASGLPLPHRYCLDETAVPDGYLRQPLFTTPGGCVPLTETRPTATIGVTDPPAPTPTPTPSPAPSPSATTGELRVVQTDTTGRTVTTAGFTFNVSLGTTSGPVVATISTDTTGSALAGALNPAVYCIAQTAVPDGFQLAPTYSPSACVTVAADPTQGHSPTTITVADPPSSTPSPSTTSAAAGAPSGEPPLGATGRLATESAGAAGAAGTVAKLLVGLGLVLLLVGGTIVVLEVRRRRQTPQQLPPDAW